LPVLVLAVALPCFGATHALPKLRFSLPPAMSCLPIAFGQAWGVFEKHGVDVELVGLSDNEERSAALLAGDIDGMVCDITTSMLLLAAGQDIVITSAAHGGDQTGSLAILSPKSFGIQSLTSMYADEGHGYKVATLYRSDLEYVTDQLMKSLGFRIDQVGLYSYWTDMLQLAVWFAVPAVPAAVLPEPYITYITHLTVPKTGEFLQFVHLSDFEGIVPPPGVVVFRRSVVQEESDAVARFYDAYREAVDLVNSKTRDEMIQEGIGVAISLFFPGVSADTVPATMLDNFVIPRFPPVGALDPDIFASLASWVNLKRYASFHQDYAAVTTDQFLR